MPISLRERFWSKVDIRGPDECWPWTASLNWRGYGQFYLNGSMVGAHRLAFQLTIGPVPPGRLICHSCDFRPCCNTSHLAPGTPQSNMDDMVSRDRHTRGARSASATMSESAARLVLRIHRCLASAAGGIVPRGTIPMLAEAAGITRGAVRDLTMRRSWKHIS